MMTDRAEQDTFVSWADFSDPKDCDYTDTKPNLWDRLTFGNLTGVIWKGWRGTIEPKDLNPLHTLYTAQDTSERLLRPWRESYNRIRQAESDDPGGGPTAGDVDSETLVRPDAKPKRINMAVIVLKAFWPYFLATLICVLIQLAVDLLPPFLIGYMLDFLNSPNTDTPMPIEVGYYVAVVLLVSQQISSFLDTHIYGSLYNIGIKCKTGFASMIYQKALRLSSKSTKEFSTGDIINLISVDLENVMWSITMSVALWSSPLKVFIIFVMIYQYLGVYCLAGAIMIVLFAPLSMALMKFDSTMQDRHMKKNDERIEMITEVFNNVKVIKLYAWENSFMARVRKLRSEESRVMYIYLGTSALIGLLWNLYPFVISAASIASYLFLNATALSPKQVLVSLSYFNEIRFDLTAFPYSISLAIKAYVSLNRIRNFLEADEVDPRIIREGDLASDEEISLRNATFAWTEEDGPVLKEINLSVKKGELVAIVGSVAAGKSSLMQAIIGEMNPSMGSVHRRRTSRLAYVPQQAWIQNKTIRQNILFDKLYSAAKYQDIVGKCCLKPDLKTLPAGDGTEIGEKGVNLSGGQKQRVSLARAVYQDADIYLLDDPLSAVDAHVSQSLFNDIIGPKGVLRRKTRLLVTHSVAILPYVDRVIVIEEGRITHQGTYDEIMAENVRLKELIETHANTESERDEEQEHVDHLTDVENVDHITDVKSDGKSPKIYRRTASVVSATSIGSGVVRADRQFSEIPSGRITEEEEMDVGKVRWSVYLQFFWRFGIIGSFIACAGLVTYKLADAYSLFYITSWTESMAQKNNKSTAEMWEAMEIYLGLGGIEVLGTLVGLSALALGCVWTSTALHNQMLYAVLRAPMSFFDSTPTGRILNRFSRDVDELDLDLYSVLDNYLECLLGVIVLVTIVCVKLPYFIALLAPLTIVFLCIQQFYMASSRQMKRLNAVTKSPVLNLFNETIAGTVSIRAYAASQNFIGRNMRTLDNNLNCVYHEYTGYRWLAIRLNLVGQLMNVAVCCLLTYMRGQLPPAIAALVLSYSLQASNVLTWIVRCGAQVENALVSAERVLDYCKTTPEADWVVKDEQVDLSWPSRGEVRIDNYSTRYREKLDLVLRGIDLHINAGERVGIVGRTGAGKSSLTLALLRIIEAAEGKIFIDGVDIATLGLHTLRSRVAMIPQDPVLFKGTLRENVDPEDRYSDEDVWTALEKAHLKTKDKPITYKVDEGGANLSVGERQLVCLSRALLRQSNLLILDEATAAVDLDTDALVQATIRDDFNKCTIITIAHRLHTIMDYDKIVVLDRGQVAEVGSPQELLGNPDGIFSSMAKDANIKTATYTTKALTEAPTDSSININDDDIQ